MRGVVDKESPGRPWTPSYAPLAPTHAATVLIDLFWLSWSPVQGDSRTGRLPTRRTTSVLFS
jgi:hypothetical protein